MSILSLLIRPITVIKNKPTTKFRLNWLLKRKSQYQKTVDIAFSQIKSELINFLNDYKGDIDIFIKYLAKCVETSDAQTFLQLMDGIINDAKDCKDDPEATRAILICKYIKLRFYVLSKFTIQWTNVKIGCNHCHRLLKLNLLFTNKLCPYCGNIVMS